MAHENTTVRISGNLFAYRIGADGEEKGIGPLAAVVIETQAQADIIRVPDTRRSRRGQTIASVAEPKESVGALELVTVPARLLAMLAMGDVAAVAEGSGTVTSADTEYEVDYWTQLPHRNLSSVVLKNTAGDVTYVVDVDYELNTRIGAYRPILGGAMAGATAGKISYSHGAVSGEKILWGTNTQVRCRLEMDGVNDIDNKDVVWRAHRALLTPNGAINLSTSQPVSAKFKLEFETPSGKLSATELEWPTLA